VAAIEMFDYDRRLGCTAEKKVNQLRGGRSIDRGGLTLRAAAFQNGV
jgi:hypothetical protein